MSRVMAGVDHDNAGVDSDAQLSLNTRIQKKRPNACLRCRKRKVRCDGGLPSCANCVKAGVNCEKTMPGQAELLDRIHQLESLIEAPAMPEQDQHLHAPDSAPIAQRSYSTASRQMVNVALPSPDAARPSPRYDAPHAVVDEFSPASSAPTNLSPQGPIAHEVGMLSLGNAADPKYLGPSSGVAFARLLYAGPSQSQGISNTSTGGTQAKILSEHTAPASLPPSKDIRRFINVYFSSLHAFYPFLDEKTFLRSAEEARRASQVYSRSVQPYTPANDHGLAQLFLVIYLGAKILEFRVSSSFGAENYLSTAMTHVAPLNLHDSLRGLQTTLLLLLVSLHSPHGLNAWYLRSTLIAACIDLGIHRKIHHEPPFSREAVKMHDMRSGIFWSVYSLDRTLSVVLGRPLTLRDEAFDVGFPGDLDATEIQQNASEIFSVPTTDSEPRSKRMRASLVSSTPASFAFRFDRIVAEIKLMLYRVCQSPARFPWPQDTENWQIGVHKACTRLLEEINTEFDRIDAAVVAAENVMPMLELKYHHTMMLLYRPSPAIPRPPALALRYCFESAMETIRIHSELFRSGGSLNQWLDAHTIFIAGITICYCLWMSPQIRKVTPARLFQYYVNMTKHLLGAFGKTWTVASGACEKFEALCQWTTTSFQHDMATEDEPHELGAIPDPVDLGDWLEMPPILPLDEEIDWTAMTIDYDNVAILPDEFQEVPDWFAVEGWLRDADTLV